MPPVFDRITADGVAWDDGLRAGGRHRVVHRMAGRARPPGSTRPARARGGIAMDGTRVAAEPRLHLVRYGPSASTVGANRAGCTAVREMLSAAAVAG